MEKIAELQSESTAKPPELTRQAESLSKVLDQSEHVNKLVKESAEELSSVNTAIKQELQNEDVLPAVAEVIGKSEAVEIKVQEASDKLTVVNQALKVEIRERIVVDRELASAIEEKEVALDAALHDALTGLPNRALFIDRLEHGIAQAKRDGGNLAVVFVDLDKFKNVNDSHGHDIGDMVLQTAAQRLKDHFRDGDTVSRYGGDEFLCLLTGIQKESDIAMIARKILKGMQAPIRINAPDVKIKTQIGASIGIAIFPQDGSTAEVLIKRADEAMYQAKKSKTRYLFAH